MLISVLVTVELETYLKNVVPNEVPASWPTEALRTQAVLARTYGLYSLKHPRGQEFHVYADSRSQVYDPTRRQEDTDQAVTDTVGIYIADSAGEPALVEYVSRCGRADCPYCEGQPGHTTAHNPDGVWPGRVCQWGMKTLAKRGMGYQGIIQHYIGNDYEFRKW